MNYAQQTLATDDEVMETRFHNDDDFKAPVVVQQADPFGGSYITAQPVGVRRNDARILQQIKTLARTNAERYYYSWEVKKKNGGKELIEGASIKLADDLARIYGNCAIDTRSIDCGDCWMIYARFIDLETGYSQTRPYRQRKSQNVGKGFEKSGDSDRALDMMMQMGVSKAIRNIVNHCLSYFVTEAFNEAKSGYGKRIAEKLAVEGGRESAIGGIRQSLESIDVSVHQAEMYIGRKIDKWTVQDIVRISSTLNSVTGGFINADEVFPPSNEPTAPQDGGGNELDKFKRAQDEKRQAQAAPPQQPPAQAAKPEVEAAHNEPAPQAQASFDVLPPEPNAPFDYSAADLTKVKGAKDAGDALFKELSAAFPPDRAAIFSNAGGEIIIRALMNKGQGVLADKIRALTAV